MIMYSVIQYIFLSLLGLATAYILFFAIAGLFYREKKNGQPVRYHRMAVLIPAYKEDSVIVNVARSALQQQYPMSLFEVIVIADSFKEETVKALRALPVTVIEVSFDKSTKTKALNKAMASLTRPFDVAVILDADNVMAPDFLQKINISFSKKVIAVQGHRTAKNLNNSWAVLDSVSEEINNHIFRKGHRALGLSSAIIGSGMAFKYDYFKNMLSTATAVGGFDKEIELKMLKEGIKIHYLNDAYVYDEKIQEAEVFSNQRRRWLSAQLHYFRIGFIDSVKDLFRKGNLDYFDKAIQFIQPPRILLLGAVGFLAFACILINFMIRDHHTTPAWIILFAACITALLISIPRSLYNLKTLKAVAGLPKGMLLMLLSLLRIKGANKNFIHTRHSTHSG